MIDKTLLLISHIADNDGVTPIILAQNVYKKVDYILLNPKEVDEVLKENIDKYEIIHITDLNITDELAQEIEKNEVYRNKIKIIDHHKSCEDLNKYSFITVIEEQNGHKESATSLYYKYLLSISKSEVLRKQSTKEFVNQVRIIDTYDFKNKKDEQAHNIGSLFSILGRENYIAYFQNYIHVHDTFEYTEHEQLLIKLEKDRKENYIKEKEQVIIKAKLDGYNVIICYAENYRSELGNYLITKYKESDFAIIINITKSISYRGKGKVDLSIFSAKYNGGGHPNASGSPLPQNLLKQITKQIYPNIKYEEETK